MRNLYNKPAPPRWRRGTAVRALAGGLIDAALVAAALMLPAGPARAVSPVLWTTETYDDFDKGKPEGAAVAGTGELLLAPALRSVRVPPLDSSGDPFLWSAALDSKGTLYVGGGSGGRVYRVLKGAQGALYYETGDLAVYALAVDQADVLYAATGPQGKIVRITGEAKGEVYYQPEDRYIWDLVAGPKGEIYAATGERGIIYKITGKGKAETFYDSEEFHVVSLALDGAGNLLAGTDGKGLLLRISPQGKAAVLHDSRLREVNAIAVDPKGTIYAAALGTEGEPAVPLPQPLPQPTPRETPPPQAGVQPPITVPGIEEGGGTTRITVTATSVATAAPGAAPLPKSEVVRIDPDGTVTTVWSAAAEIVYSLALDPSGRPILGTGEPGRVRLLTGDQQSTLLARLPESQITALAAANAQIFAATSNVGRIYALDGSAGESGMYLSAARDTRTTSRWGRISWRATVPQGARVEIATRTGNSAVPDTTWSDWSPAYASPDGSAVSSPPGRFLQWRARLLRAGAGSGPSLHAVSVAYVQANLPPVLKSLSVLPPGVIRERLPYVREQDPEQLAFSGIRIGSAGADDGASSEEATRVPDKKVYVRGMRGIDWEADDPNGDTLSFDLLFRGEGENAWKPLAKGVRETYLAFDSTMLPDGLYRVRVQASDAPSNAAGQAKEAVRDSDPLIVDNTPPSVQVAARKTGRDVTLEVTATDTPGPVARAEYSVDAARWIPLTPTDGVSDSRSESYGVTLQGLRPGEHTVIVKVTDLLGNVGAGKATFTAD